MLQYLHHPHTQLGRKPLDNQMRVALRHGPALAVGNVRPQHHIVQREARRRAVREMADRQRRRRPAVLMQEDDIAQPGRLRARNQVVQDEVAAVQPDAGR